MVTYSGFEETAKIYVSKRDLESILDWGMVYNRTEGLFNFEASIFKDFLQAYNDTSKDKIEYDIKANNKALKNKVVNH